MYPIVVINCKALPVAYISVCDKPCSRGNLDRGIVFCQSHVNVGVITDFITWEGAVGVMKNLFSIFKRGATVVGKESEPIFQWTIKHGQTVQFNVVFIESNHKLI